NLRERRLSASEQRFRSLFEDAPVAYQEIDSEGVIRRVNEAECRMLGYSAEELLGRPVWELVVPEQQQASRESVRRKISGEQSIEVFERDYVRKDGAIVYLEIHENPITDENGRISGMRSALLDISERRLGELATRKVEQYAQELKGKNEQLARALAMAREATETKNRFLANMSHELRTPLNGIIGFSELMYDGKVGPVSETHQEFLGDILTSARHLLHLINDVLDLAKVESGRMEFRPEHVDLNALIREVRDILRPLADKKEVPILFEPGEELGEVVADSARFKQVLYNYLSNAVKFTPSGGRVQVRLLASGPAEVRLEVEDTGIGIHSEDLPRLFQDFQQLSAGGRQDQGSGLGLALTKRIVEAQGGRVEVHSQFGQGSTFVAILPRVLNLSPAKAALPVLPAAAESRSSRILVIDDERDAGRLAEMLVSAGYQVQTAYTAADALAKCQSQIFEAITLDLRLPDCSGWELLRAIRATGLNGATPVIVVSLVAEKEAAAAFQINNFLTKPVEASDLVNALERAGAPPYGSKAVLVVDDDPNTLKLMQATLNGFGYHPLCASNGHDGLKLAGSEYPAAIILDLMMPVMNGFQFLEQFRHNPSATRTPVIVWTNKDLTLEEYAQLEGLAQNVVLKHNSNPASILEQLAQLLPQPLQTGS
ncbi:MAG TPA: response regulator, partial [Bryobacteraceae bacterium]|nr:response regulator [Bryobacteraceae bacterium]